MVRSICLQFGVAADLILFALRQALTADASDGAKTVALT